MRTTLLGAACAAAVSILACPPALADPAPAGGAADNSVVTQAVVGADYSYVGLDQGLGRARVYGGEAGAITPFGADFSGQVTGGYHRIDSHGFGANDWNVAGTASFDPQWGRVGANVGYTSARLEDVGGHVANYGVYGEYYAGDEVTLGLRGGGLTGSANAFGVGTGSRSGGYVGGEAIGYVAPDLALTGKAGYVGVSHGHEWTAGAHAEYLFSQSTPDRRLGRL